MSERKMLIDKVIQRLKSYPRIALTKAMRRDFGDRYYYFRNVPARTCIEIFEKILPREYVKKGVKEKSVVRMYDQIPELGRIEFPDDWTNPKNAFLLRIAKKEPKTRYLIDVDKVTGEVNISGIMVPKDRVDLLKLILEKHFPPMRYKKRYRGIDYIVFEW
jgi:hypothetical protein